MGTKKKTAADTSTSGKKPAAKKSAAGGKRPAWSLYLEQRSKPGEWTAAPIARAFDVWGMAVPDDLSALLQALDGREPPDLKELMLGSHAPALAPESNVLEQLIVQAQQYLPLWKELFSAAIEIGSTSSGDIWMYGYDPTSKSGRAQIYLYNHETDALEGPEASDLDVLFDRAIAVTEREAGRMADDAFAAAKKRLSKRVRLTYFEDVLSDLPPFQSDWVTNLNTDLRATWLVTLLSVADPSDLEIRRGFDLGRNTLLTEQIIATRAARFADFPPAALYCAFTTFFSGDDARLAQTLDACRPIATPFHRDLVRLMDELRAGRKQLGVIDDMQALRQRIIGLRLWAPASAAAPLETADAEAVASAARQGTLEALAWASIHHPAKVHAIEEAWCADASMAPTIELLRSVKRADGYRDEAAITALTERGDHRAAPLLTARLLDTEAGCTSVAFDVLADWGVARAVEAGSLAARPVDRFHIARKAFVQLVQRVGDANNGRFLLDIFRAYPPSPTESSRNEMLASLVVALGELRVEDAAELLVPHAQTTIDERGQDGPLGLSEAVLYGLGVVGDRAALTAVLDRASADARFVWRSPATCFALGELAARVGDDAARAQVRALLDPASISANEDGVAGLFRDVGGQTTSTACYIAIDDARASLATTDADRAAALATLKEMVTGVLSRWEERSDPYWKGYDGYALLFWCLLTLRRHPEFGRELAAPFVHFDVPLIRAMAKTIG